MTRTLLVVAGEDSGDLHGAELLRELKARRRAHAAKFHLAWARYARSRTRREARAALLDA